MINTYFSLSNFIFFILYVSVLSVAILTWNYFLVFIFLLGITLALGSLHLANRNLFASSYYYNRVFLSNLFILSMIAGFLAYSINHNFAQLSYSFILLATSIIVFFLYPHSIENNLNNFLVDKIRRKTLQASFFAPLFLALLLFSFKLIGLETLLFFTISILTLLTYIINYKYSVISGVLFNNDRKIISSYERIIFNNVFKLMQTNKNIEVKNITDSLTGLYNLNYLLLYTKKLIDKTIPFAIIYINVDRFKYINALYGHSIGDMVLINLAKRFKSLDSDLTTTCHIDGDNFAIIYKSDDIKEIKHFCQEIIQSYKKPMKINKMEFFLNCSLGISKYPQDSIDNIDLLSYAEYMMQEAKKSVANYIFYTDKTSQHFQKLKNIEKYLLIADYDRDFSLYYQPQFDIASNSLIGAEALLRWKHADLGYISPGFFIPIAEKAGLINEISHWVIKNSLAKLAQWNKDYGIDLVMGINISPISLFHINSYNRLTSLIRSTNINPSLVELEITENSSLLDSNNSNSDLFDHLKNQGIKLAIDDFGTGYSSLNYLKEFNVDRIKLAKELIDTIHTDKDQALVIQAIIMMANSLDIDVIAEGVELKEQLDILKKLNCNAIQGYYLGRPIPADDFEKTHLIKLLQ